MSSSASEDLTSAYTGSADICSSDYACNSEDIQVSRNSEKDDDPDPDSAELLSNCDHESSTSQPAGPSSQTATCQEQTPIEESSKKRKLRMMDEDSDGVRVKIVPCVKQQFRRRMEATRVLNDDFYVPNRAQLMLNFFAEAWRSHRSGNTWPQATLPKHASACSACFAEIIRSSSVIAVRHVRTSFRNQSVHPDPKLRVLEMTC